MITIFQQAWDMGEFGVCAECAKKTLRRLGESVRVAHGKVQLRAWDGESEKERAAVLTLRVRCAHGGGHE